MSENKAVYTVEEAQQKRTGALTSMEETRRYVLGFCLTNQGAVLIRKNRPRWIEGKWNGIGGSIEQGETPLNAMVREFREETGLVTKPEQWRCLFPLHGETPGAKVKAYSIVVFMTYLHLESAYQPFKSLEGVTRIVDGIPEPMDGTGDWLLRMCWDLHYNGLGIKTTYHFQIDGSALGLDELMIEAETHIRQLRS